MCCIHLSESGAIFSESGAILKTWVNEVILGQILCVLYFRGESNHAFFSVFVPRSDTTTVTTTKKYSTYVDRQCVLITLLGILEPQ